MSRLHGDVHNRSGWSAHSSSLVKYGRMVHLRCQGMIKIEEEEEGPSSLTTIVEKQDESGPDGRTTTGKGEKR